MEGGGGPLIVWGAGLPPIVERRPFHGSRGAAPGWGPPPARRGNRPLPVRQGQGPKPSIPSAVAPRSRTGEPPSMQTRRAGPVLPATDRGDRAGREETEQYGPRPVNGRISGRAADADLPDPARSERGARPALRSPERAGKAVGGRDVPCRRACSTAVEMHIPPAWPQPKHKRPKQSRFYGPLARNRGMATDRLTSRSAIPPRPFTNSRAEFNRPSDSIRQHGTLPISSQGDPSFEFSADYGLLLI